jgi:type IV pilus assembly protein PilY1
VRVIAVWLCLVRRINEIIEIAKFMSGKNMTACTQFFVRGKHMQHVLIALVLLASSAMSTFSYATDCVIQVTSPGPVGQVSQSRSHTFSELENITGVVDVDLDGEYNYDCEWKWVGFGFRYECKTKEYKCRDSAHNNKGYYSFVDNILSVNNPGDANKDQCRATFIVEGVEKDCTPTNPSAGGIAQVPLFLSQSAESNVMYILDDSGSMQFELMPGEIIKGPGNGTTYIFPRANGAYGGSDYNNYVPTVEDGSGYNARSRSPQFNLIYYNPSKTYRPWIKADGSSYSNASITCALHNPERAGTGADYCRNLTVDNESYNGSQWYECDSGGDCERRFFKNGSWRDHDDCNSNCSDTAKFWPAKYFWYEGNEDSWDWDDFDEKDIISTTDDYTGDGRENREDCSARATATCTYDEEIQNFANWYTYYRSRVLAARAGSGFAFAQQSSNLRVGFAALNQENHPVDGVDTSAIVTGVRTFTGAGRTDFFDQLYKRTIPNAGTPLRSALNSAGKYFSRTDDRGPWSDSPGEIGDTQEQLACRRNFSVLVTDGYWSGSDVSGTPGENNDGGDGPTHTRTIGSSYTYSSQSPFSDDRGNTLADVAMYYWKNDLRSDLANVLNDTPKTPAFWQHMVTYGVGFGVNGTITPSDAFDAIDSGANITWPAPTSSDRNKIDDLLHASVNSRGGFFSAAEPDVFANELASVLQEISLQSKSSASSIAVNSTRLDSGSLIYQASFNSSEWSGRIQAYSLGNSGALDSVYWDTNSAGKIPAHGLRNIVTGVGNQGALSTAAVNFSIANWDNLAATQRSLMQLSGDSANDAKARLDWVRGNQSRESSDFRSRLKILGDIVNSDPFYVGTSEDYGYHLLSGTEGTSYITFLTNKASRTPMLYVGANDGMLHGLNAQTGVETFAYVPIASYPNLASLSTPNYVHRYFVDGGPRANDAYIGGNWKTVLLGSMGAGGRSVFALDVTTPSNLGSSSLMWEFATASNAANKLGVAMSQPVVARLAANGKWVAIFGNGYNSGDTVKLFVVDLATGALLKAIDTGVSGDGNGLASPVPVDIDNDRITDYVYAGDLKGNLWKFDLRGNNQNGWDVAIKQGNTPRPLFAAGDTRPITSRPTVGRHAGGGYMIYFGTGKYFETSDAQLPASPSIQEFYGIRDLNSAVVTRASLQAQSILYEGVLTTQNGSASAVPVRIVSNESANTPPTYGWRLPLVSPSPATATGERVVSSPVLRNGRIIFATIIPDESVCGYGGKSWLMELDAINGGRVADPVLDVNGDGKIDYLDLLVVNGDDYPASGIGTDEMIKTPGIIGAGELEYKYTSGTSGTIGVITETGGGSDVTGRQSWRQLQ